MSVVSAFNSIYVPSPIGGSDLSAVLASGNNANGLDMENVGNMVCNTLDCGTTIECTTLNGQIINGTTINCSPLVCNTLVSNNSINTNSLACNTLVSNDSIIADSIVTTSLSTSNLNLTGPFNPTNISTTDLSTTNLTIAGDIYPILGSNITASNVGSIKVSNFLTGVGLPSGIAYTAQFIYNRGIYAGKVEVDFKVVNSGDANAKVEVFYGSVSGLNIGFSETLISGDNVIYTVSVPFFVNILNSGDIITVRMTCTYNQGGNWNTTNDSDIDMLRVF